ncbi:hypothetical protein [Candidatus Clavichlamydia salmonicola]|uniref:hypothetical protein n=1 Tax=Candidatus Clavichlamydia salmonicola TaxID=469812 RepID=UPI001890FCAA|nr:hypothetical protein [Candidatus Clavichlamydia salmonicola]
MFGIGSDLLLGSNFSIIIFFNIQKEVVLLMGKSFKICTAFLDSLFGLPIAMEVVGIVITFLCVGGDISEIIVSKWVL